MFIRDLQFVTLEKEEKNVELYDKMSYKHHLLLLLVELLATLDHDNV